MGGPTRVRSRRIRVADNTSDAASPSQILSAIPASTTEEDYQFYYLSRLREVIFGNTSSHHWFDDFGSLGARSLTEAGLDFLLDNDPNSNANTLNVVRSAGTVSQLSWTNNATSRQIKLTTFTRVGGLVTSIVTQIFSPLDGITVVAQKTETIVRVAGLTTQITTTRDV